MPVVVNGNQAQVVWTSKKSSRPVGSTTENPEHISIALINNMPDAALEDTESQFFDLLNNAAADSSVVQIKLYSLPEIPRTERGEAHLNENYFDIDDLLNNRFDGVIVTGTEPCHSDLKSERYWPALSRVLDWAERNTHSAVLSCLAAHASVLYSDGISRHQLGEKQFGVFEYKKKTDNHLIKHLVEVVHTPHSRWNEVSEAELLECGYTILTSSSRDGVNSFAKQKRDSLFVHFQGHPEYSTETLLKEYRRDIKRYLRHERETYPSMPQGYFTVAVARMLTDFRNAVLCDPGDNIMTSFPELPINEPPRNTWAASSFGIYRNWLDYLVSKKAARSVPVAVTRMTS